MRIYWKHGEWLSYEEMCIVLGLLHSDFVCMVLML
jgi:hypothetical protein